MNRLFPVTVIVVCILLNGCATGVMKFQMPPWKAQDDYQKAWKECKEVVNPREGGGFIFGPAICVLPIIAGVGASDHSDRLKMEKCMEEKGYKCTANCPSEQPKQVSDPMGGSKSDTLSSPSPAINCGFKDEMSKDAKIDLMFLLNDKMKKIAPLESVAMNSYNSVRNELKKESSVVALNNTVIPNYQRFVGELKAINPETQEVREVLKIYIEGTSLQLKSLEMMALSLRNKDSNLFFDSNKNLREGSEKIKAYKYCLRTLCNKLGVTLPTSN